MAIMKIYAGSSTSSLTELPSPVELKRSTEQIWSENTGRAQSGSNKAKMIGDSIATKHTYQIKWGVLTESQLNTITTKLTNGFFYFAAATSSSTAASSAVKYYRSEITYNIIQAGPNVVYKDATVSVIEQ